MQRPVNGADHATAAANVMRPLQRLRRTRLMHTCLLAFVLFAIGMVSESQPIINVVRAATEELRQQTGDERACALFHDALQELRGTWRAPTAGVRPHERQRSHGQMNAVSVALGTMPTVMLVDEGGTNVTMREDLLSQLLESDALQASCISLPIAECNGTGGAGPAAAPWPVVVHRDVPPQHHETPVVVFDGETQLVGSRFAWGAPAAEAELPTPAAVAGGAKTIVDGACGAYA